MLNHQSTTNSSTIKLDIAHSMTQFIAEPVTKMNKVEVKKELELNKIHRVAKAKAVATKAEVESVSYDFVGVAG